jgi:replication fork protection complex subunit Csm3/Swi3
MVEKMGHKKIMQVARMDWINEGKPHSGVHEDSLFDELELPPRDKTTERGTSRVAPIFGQAKEGGREKTPENGNGDAMDLFGYDDIYDATPRPARKQPAETGGGGTSLFGPAKGAVVDDGPPEDDLDALLAQKTTMTEKVPAIVRQSTGGQGDNFDDDLDALLAEEEMMQAEKPAAAANKAPQQVGDFDDEMEAMAEMDGLWD